MLVYQDLTGIYNDFTPKFVKRYLNAGEMIKNAFVDYNYEVKHGKFPTAEHSFKIDSEIMEEIKHWRETE